MKKIDADKKRELLTIVKEMDEANQNGDDYAYGQKLALLIQAIVD